MTDLEMALERPHAERDEVRRCPRPARGRRNASPVLELEARPKMKRFDVVNLEMKPTPAARADVVGGRTAWKAVKPALLDCAPVGGTGRLASEYPSNRTATLRMFAELRLSQVCEVPETNRSEATPKMLRLATSSTCRRRQGTP